MSFANGLAKRLGLFDAIMIVMGGIIGSGIFINPSVVARQVHTPFLILGAWLFGGAVAMAGAFVYAELAVLAPATGGQYAYLREAFHPGVAFLYGWALLLVIQTGGMAAVAVTFAKYFLELSGWHAPETVVAAAALLLLTIVNCLGVRAGGSTQNVLMILKLGAIAALVACGLFFAAPAAEAGAALLDRPVSFDLLTGFGAALTPVLFAYGGWQTASFVAGEMRNPARDLSRGILIGVSGVIAVYVSVSYVCLRVLGTSGLAATTTPATAVMRAAFGSRGATFIAAGIAISTLGFLGQGMLTAPRVYYAMAADGVFFKAVAKVNSKTAAPIAAIVLQGIWAVVVAASGKYEQILNYVVSVDFIWFGMTGCALLILRKRRGAPGHPYTALFFIVSSWLVVINTVFKYPGNSLIGIGLLLTGIPVYFMWKAFA